MFQCVWCVDGGHRVCCHGIYLPACFDIMAPPVRRKLKTDRRQLLAWSTKAVNPQVLDLSVTWTDEQRQSVAAHLLHQANAASSIPPASICDASTHGEDRYSPRRAVPVATWARSGAARRMIADDYAATATMVDPPIGPLNTICGVGNPPVCACAQYPITCHLLQQAALTSCVLVFRVFH